MERKRKKNNKKEKKQTKNNDKHQNLTSVTFKYFWFGIFSELMLPVSKAIARLNIYSNKVNKKKK